MRRLFLLAAPLALSLSTGCEVVVDLISDEPRPELADTGPSNEPPPVNPIAGSWEATWHEDGEYQHPMPSLTTLDGHTEQWSLSLGVQPDNRAVLLSMQVRLQDGVVVEDMGSWDLILEGTHDGGHAYSFWQTGATEPSLDCLLESNVLVCQDPGASLFTFEK